MTVVSAFLKPIHSHWEWQEDGACTSIETNTFFLEHNLRGKEKFKKEKEAVSICNTCPVKMKCLEHALNTPEIYGVWGGMTEDERHQILRQRGVKFEYIRV